MVIELPQDLEKFISEQVTRGRCATADEAIAEAVRLLRLQPTLSVGGARTPEDVDRQLLARGSNAAANPDNRTAIEIPLFPFICGYLTYRDVTPI